MPKPTPRRRSDLEILEPRLLFAVHNDSFDATGLTTLRSSAQFASITGSGVGIAVLDTGVYAKNPDLSGKVRAFYNAVESPVPATTSAASVAAAVDPDGHGSHVSGIAASSDPAIGVAYGAGLIDVKVIADTGENQLAGDPLLRGLDFVQNFASQFNIKVVNLSLGESTSSGGVNDNTVPAADDISREIRALESMGITVVAASGNSYANDPAPGESYPAVVSTIAVASTWADAGPGYDFGTYAYGTPYDNWAATESSAAPDQFSATSQRSTLANQVAAPGVDIYSDWNGSGTGNGGSDLEHNTLSGTSMATPFVSGLVALMQQAAFTYGGRYITDPQQVLTIIKQTSDVIADPNVPGDARVPISNGALTGGASQPLDGTGATYTRVNVFKAIQAVQALFTGTISNADTDNTTATATSVPALDGTAVLTESGAVGTDGLNAVGANDVDLYKVTLGSPGTLTAASADTNAGQAFTGELRLFSSSGAEIASATGSTADGYPTLVSSTAAPLAAGVYYVGISSAGNGAYSVADGSGATGGSTTGDYQLTLTLANPDPNGVVQGAVAVDLTNPDYEFTNGTVASFYNGTLGSDPPPTGGTVRVAVPNGDVDMFKVVAPDTGTLTAQVSAENYGVTGADTYVEVFTNSAEGTPTVITSDGTSAAFASDSNVRFDVVRGRTYYVAVTAFTNRAFDPSDPYNRVANSTAAQKSYDLYLTFDNGNADGTALLATPATVGTPLAGAIQSTRSDLGSDGGSKYVDWYRYTVPADGLLDLTAAATSTGFSPDLQLWTLGASSSITEVGGITGSGQSLIDQFAAGTVVYASVTGRGNANFNWYSLGSGSGGQTGTYTLTSTILPAANFAALNDNSIDYGTPAAVTAGSPVSANLGNDAGLIVGSADVDLYKFVPTATAPYDIRTDTSQEGSADTVLRVFDANGNQLSLNDNASSATTASFIRAALTAGVTYYIGVSGAGNAAYNPVTDGNTATGATGNYVLSVSSASAATPAVTVSSPAAVPAGPGAAVDFVVSLDQPSATDVVIDYATADGTAVAGTDYTATSGTLTIPAGQTSATVAVSLLVDQVATGTTTFNLDLTNPGNNAVIDAGQGVATITHTPVTSLSFGGRARVAYLDSTGRPVTVSLSGPGTGTVDITGADGATGPADAVTITLTGTTARSRLNVVTTRGAVTTLDGLLVNGDLGQLAGGHVELTGDLTVTGTVASLILAGAAGNHRLSVQGSAAAGSFVLGNVTDLVVASAEPLRTVQVISWTNQSNADSLTAPSIHLIRSAGDFGPSVSVAGGIDAVRVGGAVTGGSWSAGSIGSVIARSTGAAWSAAVAGPFGSILITTDAAGTLSAGSFGSIQVRGNLDGGTITTTASGATPSIRSLVVNGTVSGSTIRSAGTVDAVRVGAITGSEVLAGIAPATSSLPTTASAFAAAAAVESFAVTGVRGATVLFGDTVIAAASLGRVSVAKVQTADGGTPFGFAAESLASFTDAEPGVRPFRWDQKLPPSDLAFAGDFTVRLL